MATCNHTNDDGSECDRQEMTGWGLCPAHWNAAITRKPASVPFAARLAADIKASAAKAKEDARQAR
jgi:hypothetical protein